MDFKNTIIVLTSNLGSEILAAQPEGGPTTMVQGQVMRIVRAHFRPEFLRTVRIFNEMKEAIEHHVAAGSAVSDVDFLEEAVRYYAEYLADDEDHLIAAGGQGILAAERGDYVTISGLDDVAALQDRVWKRTMVLAKEMRAAVAGKNDEVRAEAKAGE